jgi:uncharacterized protein (TIGR00255 family)
MHSMTGFGRGSAATDKWHATVEVSSVNRKQAEVVVQIPREVSTLESRIRKTVVTGVSRGRIQVSIHLERGEAVLSTIRVDTGLARAFHDSFKELSKAVGHEVLPSAADYLRQPGIMNQGTGEMEAEDVWLAIEPALKESLEGMVGMRAVEGTHLRKDLIERLVVLKKHTGSIIEHSKGRLSRQREMLLARLRDAELDLDPSDERVLRELALFADRCDISEEITRLDSHFAKFLEYLDAAEAPGRALDFLCQELFREFNTIGAKASDARISQTIVEAKTELEKIREQVQNVE